MSQKDGLGPSNSDAIILEKSTHIASAKSAVRPAAVAPFTFRATTGRDVEGIGELLSAGYATALAQDYHPNVLKAALPVIGAPKPSLICSGSYFVADSGQGNFLGCGGWSWNGPVGGVAPRDTAHLRHIVVAPGSAGRGLGRLLVDHIIASAQGEGVRRLLCIASISSAGFYERLGFQRRGDVALTLGAGLSFPAVHFEIKI